ncbi:MAG: MOSC domain-containing protein [Geminicoccaceae bacterium]
MRTLGRLAAIWRFPVKSMAGEALDEAAVGPGGIDGDRRHAFVRDPGPPSFPWLTAREVPELLRWRPAAGPDGTMAVARPDGTSLPLDSAELRAELGRRAGCAVRLERSDAALADCHPVSLLGTASLRQLGKALGTALDGRRFRMNLLAEWDEERPFLEDGLVGRVLRIGDSVRLRLVERDPRCGMIALDPDTARPDPRVVRAVQATRGGLFGVYATVLAAGTLQMGSVLTLEET